MLANDKLKVGDDVRDIDVNASAPYVGVTCLRSACDCHHCPEVGSCGDQILDPDILPHHMNYSDQILHSYTSRGGTDFGIRPHTQS